MTGMAKPGTDQVTLSRNETESLCMKAARGAGFSWGLAEEAGFAAGWLAAQGIDGATPFLAFLTRNLERPAGFGTPIPRPGHWQSVRSDPLCPIQLGAALTDHAALPYGPFGQDTQLGPVETPLFLLPFLVRAAQICQRTLMISWRGGRLCITPEGAFNRLNTVAWGGLSILAIRISTSPEDDMEPIAAEPTRLPSILLSTANGLASFALKTTVPASDVSRTGAGSSTADND